MTKTLILTPNKNEMCGMYQLAKDLAKEFDGDIHTRQDNPLFTGTAFIKYDKVISLMYPMHNIAKKMKTNIHWICYNQGIPPITKTYFPNFWRRQAMRYINWRNNATMKGADEYWDVTEREQKPRYKNEGRKVITKEIFDKYYENGINLAEPYAIYLGRTSDYKNYWRLKQIMKELNIPLVHPENEPDVIIYALLSNAKMYVTMSLWEGYGRGVMEAEVRGIPAVSYDVGTQKRHTSKGICVPVGDEEAFKKAVLKVWNET